MDIYVDTVTGTWGDAANLLLVRNVTEEQIDDLGQMADSDVIDWAYRMASRNPTSTPNADHAAAKAAELIARKSAGGDCTADESAWIKGYFDAYHPVQTQPGQALADAYPLEKDEWFDELERGFRPNDTGQALIDLQAHHDRSGAWHQRALDLADQCTAMAKEIPSATTANKLYSAAYSLRWQVRWAQDHLPVRGVLS